MKKLRIPISIQISIFLILVAFIPVAVMMALNTYEKQLLSMLENSNVQQARLVSAALESYSVLKGTEITEEAATLLLKNMDGNFDSRIRILDKNGLLLADSATLENSQIVKPLPNKSTDISSSAEQSVIYKLFSFPIRIYRKFFRPPVSNLYDTADYYSHKTVYDGEEVLEALKKRYGAITRISSGNQVSVTLYSALPIFSENQEVSGVVLVNRSSYRILQNLCELRLDLAKIFLKSLIVVALITLFLFLRISIPLKKLSRQTVQCADKKGRVLFTSFVGKNRNDEIGELSRSFSALIEKLNKKINFSQAFSSDISHEFKNPLTAIRSSAELLENPEISTADREELSKAIVEEVEQLQSLLTGVRNISMIDAGQALEETKELPVNLYISNIVEQFQKKYDHITIQTQLSEQEILLLIPENYLYRICDNLIGNAISFGNTILVSTGFIKSPNQKESDIFVLTVEDDGPGIREGSTEKIFERFYSERLETENTSVQDKTHTGLGLSIVKAIVDSLEGEIAVSKSSNLGGALFKLSIPLN